MPTPPNERRCISLTDSKDTHCNVPRSDKVTTEKKREFVKKVNVATWTPSTYEMIEYCIAHAHFDPSLMKLRDETMLLPNGRWATDLDTLAAIEMLVSLVNPRKVVDVGTFTGISALLFALMVPDDNGTVITIDHSEEHLCLAHKHWKAAGVAHKIEAKIGDGLIVLDEICQTQNKHCFDVAYIDANKEGYDAYYEKLLPMIRPHGLILMDNLLLSQKVVYNEITDDRTLSVRKLNRKLHQDSRINFNLLTIGDGLGVCRVKP